MNIDCDFGNTISRITDEFIEACEAYREASYRAGIYLDMGFSSILENRKKHMQSISLENEDSDTSNALDEFLSEFAIKKSESEVSQY